LQTFVGDVRFGRITLLEVAHKYILWKLIKSFVVSDVDKVELIRFHNIDLFTTSNNGIMASPTKDCQ